MKWFYTILIMIISFSASTILNWIGNQLSQDVYWTNTLFLVAIIGVTAYYRYREYEINKANNK